MDFNGLVEEYAALAAYVDDLEKQINKVKEARDNLKAALQAAMVTIGIDSAKSAAGHTITRVTNKFAKIVDANAFKDFLADTGELDLIQNRASVDACVSYAEENGVPPPGVELGSQTTLRFTRSK